MNRFIKSFSNFQTIERMIGEENDHENDGKRAGGEQPHREKTLPPARR